MGSWKMCGVSPNGLFSTLWEDSCLLLLFIYFFFFWGGGVGVNKDHGVFDGVLDLVAQI